MTLRVIFFGNSESVFSNRHFQALVQARARIAAVVDVPPAKRTSTNTRHANVRQNFVEVARRRQIPAFEPPSPNLPEFVSAARACAPDLLISVGYMNLLKPEILSVPRLLAANFHASLLPAYRGKHPVFWALRHGERWVGLTVHVMDPSLDTGDILYQVRVRTRMRDSVGSLYDRIMNRSLPLVKRLLDDAEAGQLVRAPQSNQGASYYSGTQEKDFKLDWTRDAEELRCWIQTSPGQCFMELAGRRVFFGDAERVANAGSQAPGVVMNMGRTRVTIAAGRDALRVHWMRLDQDGEKPAAEVLNRLGLGEGADLLHLPNPNGLSESRKA